MNDHRSEYATSVLSGVMGVIPRTSIEICVEGIRETLPIGDWALLYAWNTVHPPVGKLV
jgi:hypothetical protein